MYCSQCGKKVMENMLFCPFCGSPIIIPDQDEEIIKPTAVVMAVGSSQAPETPAEEIIAVSSMAFEDTDADSGDSIETEAASEISAEPEDLEENTEAGLFFEEEETAGTTDEPEAPESDGEDSAEEPAFVSLFDEKPEDEAAEEPEEDFRPLEIEEEKTEIQWQKIIPKAEKKPPELRKTEDQSVRLDGHAPRLESRGEKQPSQKGKAVRSGRSAETFVPVRPMNPEDMFMDDLEDDEDFDVYQSDYEEDDRIYEFEDEDEGNFFMRHIRGLIGLSLMLVLALIFVFYGFSAGGQETLAQLNLAWKPEAYSKLAYEYYQQQRYNLAGSFYEKALSRDADNYSYAESAAMVYITGDNADKAATMLKKCIEISPSKAEPYVYLMNLYPDSATRPWDISQLLLQGYRTTGDERLKSIAQ